jgi:hypothetical protein
MFLEYTQQYMKFQYHNFTILNEIQSPQDIAYHSWDHPENPFSQANTKKTTKPDDVYFNLPLTSTDSLNFITEIEDDSIVHLYPLDFALWLQTTGASICLKKIFKGSDIGTYLRHIDKCLRNECPIPTEVTFPRDLGLDLNNHSYYELLSRPCTYFYPTWYWIANDTILLISKDSFDSCVTFLYNDDQGSIVFQVSKIYPNFFKSPSWPEQTISYEDWLPQYKILYKTIIPHEDAQNWHQQLQILYEKIESNVSFKRN